MNIYLSMDSAAEKKPVVAVDFSSRCCGQITIVSVKSCLVMLPLLNIGAVNGGRMGGGRQMVSGFFFI